MGKYRTTADDVKDAIKALGYNNRQVGVRNRISAIDVSIKDIRVDFEAVKKAVGVFESYQTCEVSGEILCGGNTFVFVNYPYETRDAVKANEEFKKFLEDIKELTKDLTEAQGRNNVVTLNLGKTLCKYEIYRDWNDKFCLEVDDNYIERENFYDIEALAYDLYIKTKIEVINVLPSHAWVE